MGTKASTAGDPGPTARSEGNHALWCVTGIGVGVVWTAIGWGLAGLQGTGQEFLREWFHLQGFFLIALGTWLRLIIRSGTFRARISDLRMDGIVLLGLVSGRRIRAGIVYFVGIAGTASLIGLGFPTHGLTLAFMWVTCAWICFTAGAATLHTIEVLTLVHGLLGAEIKAFRYAPARTPELRSVVSYFCSFTLLLTVGYAFALVATLDGHWTGPIDYIDVVRIFWPLLYIPTCSVAMIYPHVVAHKLIQREKERILLSCQEDIDDLLARYRDLKPDDISRTNTLAQLFDRIVATPNYVVDFGIAVRTILPLLVNLVSLFAKAAFTYGPAKGA